MKKCHVHSLRLYDSFYLSGDGVRLECRNGVDVIGERTQVLAD